MNNTNTAAHHLLLVDLPLGPDPSDADNSNLNLVTCLISNLLLSYYYLLDIPGHMNLVMVDLASLSF